MRRIKLILAASALMVVLLAMTASPAWAPRECDGCGQGLDTAEASYDPDERAVGDPQIFPGDEGEVATREAPADDNAEVQPGYGIETAPA
jgi:hypothetical protein